LPVCFFNLIKTLFYVNCKNNFWKDSNGNEVDVIADAGTKLMPIEIKSGQTLNRDFFTGLERWLDLAGDQAISPTLVYGGINKYYPKGHQYLWLGCRITGA